MDDLPFTNEIPKVRGKNVFKENWNKVDETCPHCHQVTKRQRGLTKQNLKRLITPQWNMTELVITLMLILVIVIAFAYKSETQTTRDWLKSMTSGNEETCKMVCDNKCHLAYTNVTNLNGMPTNALWSYNQTLTTLNELNGTNEPKI